MAPPPEREAAQLRATADTLAPGDVREVTRVPGGGNNRIFRVEVAGGERFALKAYDAGSGDADARLDAEFRALSFIWWHGLRAVPRPLAIDAGHVCALFGWVEGSPVPLPREADIDAALQFLAELRRLASSCNALTLPEAKEACLAGAEVVAQIERRLSRLDAVAGEHAELARFLSGDFVPVFEAARAAARRGYGNAGLDFEAAVASRQRTLSPSDFGFHNALKQRDGGLVFVDFEYFGWDDPAKLVSDFLLHPGMTLDMALKRRFVAGAREVFAGDPEFATRLRLLYPLFGARWCLILLNEFLPRRWRRRVFAGATDREVARALQLSKARGALGHVAETGGGLPFDA